MTTKFDTFIVLGGMSWGRAHSVDDAFINWLKIEKPRKACKVIVWQTNAEAEVDGMGTLYYAKGSKKLAELDVPQTFLKAWEQIDIDIEEMLTEANDAVDFSVMEHGEVQA
jgi:hypothetical protein